MCNLSSVFHNGQQCNSYIIIGCIAEFWEDYRPQLNGLSNA